MSSAMCQQSVEKTLADLGLPLRPAWVAQCLSGHHQHLNEEEFYRLWLESDMKESSSGILPVGIGDENEEWGTKILPGRFMLQVESWKNVGEPLEHRSKDSANRLLCIEVTDGVTSAQAIEYRHIDGLELKILNVGLKIAVTSPVRPPPCCFSYSPFVEIDIDWLTDDTAQAVHLGTFLLSPENTQVIGGCLPPRIPVSVDGVVVPLPPSLHVVSSHQEPPLSSPYSSHASHPHPICGGGPFTITPSSGDDKNIPLQLKDGNIVGGGPPAPQPCVRTAMVVSGREGDKSSSTSPEPPLQVKQHETPQMCTDVQQYKMSSSSTRGGSLHTSLLETPLRKNIPPPTVTVTLDDLEKWHGSSVIVRANVTGIQDRLRLKKLAYSPLPVLIEDSTASARARISPETCTDLLGGMRATEFKTLGKKDIAAVSKIAEAMGRCLLDHEWEIAIDIPNAMEDSDTFPVITQMKTVS